jgi:NADP-dependent 3-hydroxy acid dehydrogenase YdfG
MHLHIRGYRSASPLRVGENLQGTTRGEDGGRMKRLDVRGRTSVITGAASGMGAEVARELDRRGARLALLDRNADGLAALTAELTGTGHTSHVVDLTDDDAVFALAAAI